MRRLTRTSILAALCVAALIGNARALDYIDTTSLPRAEGAHELRAHPASTRIPSGAAPMSAATVRTEPPQAAPAIQGGRVAPEEATARDTPAAPAQAAAPAQGGNDDLEVALDESSGLPVPKRKTLVVGDKGPYRNSVHVETPLDLSVVLGFYRAELNKRGWTEDTGAVVRADRAQLAFATADGPALLKAVRQDDKTIVDLWQRDPSGAKTVGLLPKAGQARVMLGNLTDEDAVITINKRTIKVAAGAGRKSPDGPKIDLPPGKYKYTLKLASGAAASDEVEVGADEAWGLLVDLGELVPRQLY